MAINFRQPLEKAAEAFIAKANHSQPAGHEEKTVVNTRYNSALLAEIDADTKRLGINRTAWLHMAANRMLKKD